MIWIRFCLLGPGFKIAFVCNNFLGAFPPTLALASIFVLAILENDSLTKECLVKEEIEDCFVYLCL